MKVTGTGPVLIDSEEKCQRLLEKLPLVHVAACDVETNATQNRFLARPVTVQLYWGDRPYMVTEQFLPRLKPWLDSKPTGIFYSAKGDLHWLQNANMPWKGDVHDALVVDYLCDENVKVHGQWEESLKKRHGEIFKHESRGNWKKNFGKRGADQVIAEEGYDKLLPYGCQDVVETWDVYQHQKSRLEKLNWAAGDNMFQHYLEYEAPYTKVLYKMERRGCRIDEEFLHELNVVATRRLEEIERKFYKTARDLEGAKFDEFVNKHQELGHSQLITSAIQLGQLFYDVIGYPEQFTLAKNKLGKKVKRRTSDAEALERLARDGYELPVILDQFRKIDKLHGTYIVGMLNRLWNGRLHTDFQQAFTLTGRLSSRDPNLQNIPRVENDPFGLRDAFIASPGMRILSLDYSQIEVRIAAHMSGDPGLIAACRAKDIYVEMAKILFPHPEAFWATPKEGPAGLLRQVVKAIVLGILFGKQAESIGRELNMSETRAQNFINQFFERFPKMFAFMEKLKRDCRNRGYVRTITGRYRRIPEIRSSIPAVRSHAERQSLNSPIQGSAFDVIEKAMLNIDSAGICEEHGGHMILQVHDEILFEFPKESIYEVQPKLVEIMEHPFASDLLVPIKVAGDIAMSWGDAK